jgi:hypothetical protein
MSAASAAAFDGFIARIGAVISGPSRAPRRFSPEPPLR